MNPDPQKAEELFDRALQFEPEERAAFLAGACGNDVNLRRRVEDLLLANSAQTGFLADDQPTESAATLLDESALTEGSGSQIGRYKLLEKLGEGGFGSVWAAEQKEPVRRRVALKIIKLGMDTKQVVARFEAERQALALMDHPNISKVLDAGATDTGRPYFVMELVKGIAITKYCEHEKLSTQDRLDLFIKVCQAIQHAHQKGIIHRDIKPSNIMVTLHDGVPVPKVIDFGIAKATQQELTEKTIYTQYSQFIGTPAYMSPEQAEMSGLDIDTRSDIYSLGVLLYELLTGTTPFDSKELMNSGLDEMRKIIREREPVRPSTRLTQTANDPKSTIINHRSSIEDDLDWIVMKCLEKDRQRRYDTANGLASDIKRHLSNEPIVARPPSAIYKWRKAIRRNRLAYSSGIAVAAALVIAVIGTTAGMVRADRQRAAAEEAKQLTEKRFKVARQFVNSLVSEVAPEFYSLIGASKAKEAMARASVEFLESMGDSADFDEAFQFELAQLYSDMADALGAVYSPNSTGDYETALKFSQKSLSISRRLEESAPNDTNTLKLVGKTIDQAGSILAALGHTDEAMTHFQELDSRLARQLALNPNVPEIRVFKQIVQLRMGHLVRNQGRVEEALENYYLPASKELLELEVDKAIPSHRFHMCYVAHVLVGGSLFELGRYSESGHHIEMAFEWKRFLIEQEPNDARYARDWADLHNWKGGLLVKQGQFDEGMAYHDEAVRLAGALVERDPSNGKFHEELVSAMRWQAKGRTDAAGNTNLSAKDRIALLREGIDLYGRCKARLNSPEIGFLRARGRDLKETISSELEEAHAALAELAGEIDGQ